MGKEGTPKPTQQPTAWEIEQAREHAMNNLSSEPDEREDEIAIINEEVKKGTKKPPQPTPKKSPRQKEIDKQLEEWSPW